MTKSLLPAALLALCVAGCAGGGERARNASQRGASASDSGTRSPPDTAVKGFSPERQAFMKEGLHQFSQGDPRWPATRAEWLAMGPDEADFLVQTLWAALLKAQAVNQPELVERARHELGYFIKEPAIPMSAQLLAGGTVYSATDPESGEQRDVGIDDLTRREASEVLSLIGAPAVPAVTNVLASAPSKAGRRAAIETLGNIGARGVDAAATPILPFAKDEDDVLRVTAVHALSHFHDELTRAALLEALRDPEELVRTKAAESLLARRERSAAAEIHAAAERAREGSHLAEAAAMDRTASRLESMTK